MERPSKRLITHSTKVLGIPILFKDMRRPSILIESYAFTMSCVKIQSSFQRSLASSITLFRTFNGVTVDSSFSPQKLCPVRIECSDKILLSLLVTIFVIAFRNTSKSAMGLVLLIYENFSGFGMGI